MKHCFIYSITFLLIFIIGFSSCQRKIQDSVQSESSIKLMPVHKLNSLPQASDSIIINDRKSHPDVYNRIDSILKTEVDERIKNRNVKKNNL